MRYRLNRKISMIFVFVSTALISMSARSYYDDCGEYETMTVYGGGDYEVITIVGSDEFYGEDEDGNMHYPNPENDYPMFSDEELDGLLGLNDDPVEDEPQVVDSPEKNEEDPKTCS